MAQNKNGKVVNLENQIESFFRTCNEGGHSSRERNKQANLRFAKYLGEHTNVQKLKNAEGRHLEAYVEDMKARGLAPSTIISDLSGIRFYASRKGNKNTLPTNKELCLDKREIGKYDRAWLPQEITRCYELATHKGRMDVVISMDFMLHFGLRIDEASSLRVSYLMRAQNYNQLTVTGKGGKTRVITYDKGSKQSEIIDKWLSYAKASGKYPKDYLICDNKHRSVEKAKKSMENWFSRAKLKITEPDRQTVREEGKKERKESISFHGLRHTFAQNYLTELSYMKGDDAGLEVSRTLGHERGSVTYIYMSEQKS